MVPGPPSKLLAAHLAAVVLLSLGWLSREAAPSLAQETAPSAPQAASPAPAPAVQPPAAPRTRRVAQAKRPGEANTIGIVTGPPTETDFTIAHEIATVLATGQETGPRGEVALRIVPLVGRGGIQNIRDILQLPGADLTITQTPVLDGLRESKELGDITKKLVYIAPLFHEEFHLLARPEIRSVADLAGRKVNLGEGNSGGEVLAREMLNRLGIKAKQVSVDQNAAVDGMRKGEIAATILVTGKPAHWLGRFQRDEGFHFIPVPYTTAFGDEYVPATLTPDDYPNLIPAGERIDTVAVGSVLVAYSWPRGSARYRLLELFVNNFFSRISEFQEPIRHPKWKEVNVAAVLPAWRRFAAAELWLKRSQPDTSDQGLRSDFERFLDQTGTIPPAGDRGRLFEDFLRWRKETGPQ